MTLHAVPTRGLWELRRVCWRVEGGRRRQREEVRERDGPPGSDEQDGLNMRELESESAETHRKNEAEVLGTSINFNSFWKSQRLMQV